MAHPVVRAQGSRALTQAREGRRNFTVGDFIQLRLKWKRHKALEIMPSCIWFQRIPELYSQVLTYNTLTHKFGNGSVTELEQGQDRDSTLGRNSPLGAPAEQRP